MQCPYLAFGLQEILFLWACSRRGGRRERDCRGRWESWCGGSWVGGRGNRRGDGGQAFREVFASSDLSSQAWPDFRSLGQWEAETQWRNYSDFVKTKQNKLALNFYTFVQMHMWQKIIFGNFCECRLFPVCLRFHSYLVIEVCWFKASSKQN